MLSTDVQLAAADSQQRTVGELLTIQFYFDEVVLPRIRVLDSNLQNQL